MGYNVQRNLSIGVIRFLNMRLAMIFITNIYICVDLQWEIFFYIFKIAVPHWWNPVSNTIGFITIPSLKFWAQCNSSIVKHSNSSTYIMPISCKISRSVNFCRATWKQITKTNLIDIDKLNDKFFKEAFIKIKTEKWCSFDCLFD